MNKQSFITELSNLKPCATFLTLHKYKNDHGEVADHNIVFHISYKNALEKSILTLKEYIPQSALEGQAKVELLESFNNSLSKIEETSIEEINDGYHRFFDDNKKYIKGIKLHEESNTLHLYGFVVNKRIIEKGEYSPQNKRPLTLAKDKLRTLCTVSKFRQYKITPDQVEKISVQNLNLLPPSL